MVAGGGARRERRHRFDGRPHRRSGGGQRFHASHSSRRSGRAGGRCDVDGRRRIRFGERPVGLGSGGPGARARASSPKRPKTEQDELTRIYIGRGLEAALARKVALQLMAHDALGAHARDELGISDLTAAQAPSGGAGVRGQLCDRCGGAAGRCDAFATFDNDSGDSGCLSGVPRNIGCGLGAYGRCPATARPRCAYSRGARWRWRLTAARWPVVWNLKEVETGCTRVTRWLLGCSRCLRVAGAGAGVAAPAAVAVGAGVEAAAVPATSGWVEGVYQPASNFTNRCAAPRSGTSDVTGTATDENNWLRSWTNDLYLWYSEVPDLNPALYTDPRGLLRPAEDLGQDGRPARTRTSSISPIRPLSGRRFPQGGQSVGYGVELAFISDQLVASRGYGVRPDGLAGAHPREPRLAVMEILTIDGTDLVNDNTSAASIRSMQACFRGMRLTATRSAFRKLNGATRNLIADATPP